jgi:hypothetical protein
MTWAMENRVNRKIQNKFGPARCFMNYFNYAIDIYVFVFREDVDFILL